jgi:Zn-dependent protease with chaperone function
MKLTLCVAAAITFALCAIPSFCANAAPADECQKARAHDSRVGSEIADPRVINALTAVVEASGFRRHVVVCEIATPHLNATVEFLGRYYYIGVTRSLLEDFTDAELQAVLGHEIAHLVLGHRAPGFELTNSRAARYEQAADALSARWFDKAAMQSVLEKLRVDARTLPNASLRNRAIMEIDARINALQ